MPSVRESLPTRIDIEKALGFRLSSLTRLKGGSSPNFRAVRAADGLPFLIKIMGPSRAWVLPALIAHLEEMSGTKAVRRLFRQASGEIGNFKILCLEWCNGVSKMPHQLSRAELYAFLDAYIELSAALQKTTHVAMADDLDKWKTKILRSTGFWAGLIRNFVRRHVPDREISRNPSRTIVIFGDFHHGNVLFENGCVTHFLDLESFSYGYATEDIVRYFTCAYEHLPLGGLFHRSRTLDAFREAVSYLPYGQTEWLLALDAQILRKLEGYDGYGLFRIANLLSRVRFYEALRKIILKARTTTSPLRTK